MDDREALEADVRRLCTDANYAGAAERAIRGYGPEMLGFLLGVTRNEDEAADAFASVSEVLWKKLPTFAWESTLRTWLYAIARRVLSTQRRDAGRRRKRERLETGAAFAEVAAAVRTGTLGYLRTEKRTRLQALRDELPEEDRMLLILRVDRGLEWNELARILAESGERELDAAGLTREAARLRKRFQIVKDRLREAARREGLVE